MKPKVLLFVDDDCHMAWAFGSDLLSKAQDAGLQLRIFTDADKALEFITKDNSVSISCAIVDLWMQNKATGEENPNKGNEIIDALKRLNPVPKIAVLSAHIDENAKARFEQSKIVCFRKPAMSSEVVKPLV
jgi:DNA-binding NtrC family response regulator